jgi:hypothetical protein
VSGRRAEYPLLHMRALRPLSPLRRSNAAAIGELASAATIWRAASRAVLRYVSTSTSLTPCAWTRSTSDAASELLLALGAPIKRMTRPVAGEWWAGARAEAANHDGESPNRTSFSCGYSGSRNGCEGIRTVGPRSCGRWPTVRGVLAVSRMLTASTNLQTALVYTVTTQAPPTPDNVHSLAHFIQLLFESTWGRFEVAAVPAPGRGSPGSHSRQRYAAVPSGRARLAGCSRALLVGCWFDRPPYTLGSR